MRTWRDNKGFNLSEVLIVIMIIGVLIAIAIPTYSVQIEKSRDAATANNLRLAYAEANSIYERKIRLNKLAEGATSYAVTINDVVFESRDSELSYQKETLPFELGDGMLPVPAGAYNVTFHFSSGGTVVATLGGSGTPDDPTPEDPEEPEVKYTVTFSAGDNGSIGGESSFEVVPGAKVTLPTTIPDEGYVFDKWEPQGAYTTSNLDSVSGNYEFKAIFIAKPVEKHTVKFYAGDYGTISATEVEVSHGKSVTEEGKEPTVTPTGGYAFTGWAPKAGSTYTINTPVIDDSFEFTATYAEAKYTVTFKAGTNGSLIDGDGHEVSEISVPAAYKSTVTPPTVKASDNFTHIGWNPSIDTPITGDTTFTAQYTEKTKWTVKFYTGTNGSLSGETELKITDGETIKDSDKPTVTPKSGYRFVGWEPPEGSHYSITDPVTGNFDFIAKYIKQHTVTFSGGGSTYCKSIEFTSKTVDEGSIVTAPTVTAQDGYTHTGWDPSIETTPITGDITFTAQYTANKYAVTYNGGGSTYCKSIEFTSREVEYGHYAPEPNVEPQDAYIFTGWSPSIKDTPITGNITFTAQYTPKQVWTVTFYAGDYGEFSGGANQKSVSVYDGDSITEAQYPGNPTPKDSNKYTFTGWAYNDSPISESQIRSITVNSPITFVAQYKEKESGGGGCFASGTLITLVDGSQKPVEELTFDDMLLVWNFFDGSYSASPAVALVDHGEDVYTVANLQFSDGTRLSIIGDHGVFDYDLNRFVFLTPAIGANYIGHRFVKYAADGSYDLVTLESVEVTQERTHAWSIVSAGALNTFASDMLTLAPPSEAFSWMPMGEKLHYDVEQLQREIAEHGTFEYAQFADLVTEEQFEALNGRYLKVVVDKGLMSVDDLCEMVKTYLPFMQ